MTRELRDGRTALRKKLPVPGQIFGSKATITPFADDPFHRWREDEERDHDQHKTRDEPCHNKAGVELPSRVGGQEKSENLPRDIGANEVRGPLAQFVAARLVALRQGGAFIQHAGVVIIGEEDVAGAIFQRPDEDTDDLPDAALEIAVEERPRGLAAIGRADPDDRFARGLVG